MSCKVVVSFCLSSPSGFLGSLASPSMAFLYLNDQLQNNGLSDYACDKMQQIVETDPVVKHRKTHRKICTFLSFSDVFMIVW